MATDELPEGNPASASDDKTPPASLDQNDERNSDGRPRGGVVDAGEGQGEPTTRGRPRGGVVDA